MTGGYQLRREARRMRRYGLQPMIVMPSGDHLPEIAVVIIARWLWRYRSELAPLTATVVTALAAWLLHATHPHVWPIVAIPAAVISGVVLGTSRRLGLSTRAERIYAATVVATGGAWLAAATALGPWRSPLGQILAIGGLVLAVPWWAHRRRRAKVRVERTLAAWPEIAQSTGLGGSRVMSAVVDVWGWRARFALARGQTITDVIGKIPAIESGLGTFRGAVRVYPTPDDLASRFELRVLDADPHADAITWPGPSVTTITEPIEFGPFEDAAPARVLFLRRHAVIGGVSGSGKSGGVNVLTASLSACADVVIWAVDLKRGMELSPWQSCLDRLATTPAEARSLFADAVAVLEARAEYLAAIGRRVWEPSAEMPALVIIVDEYAELTESAPGAAADADSIGRRGRAVAVTLVVATQRPTQKAMGQGALRSQLDIRICFRVRERKDTDLILGQGMLTAGWQPHTLNAPGKFLISAPEHDLPRRARAYLLTDDAVAETARNHAARRPALDAISRQAIGQRAQANPDATTAFSGPLLRDDAEDSPGTGRGAPEAMLWGALRISPAEGVTVPDLMAGTGMSRPWVYQRLADLAERGQVTQVSRGHWRAVTVIGDSQ
jgi:hypothetical protein